MMSFSRPANLRSKGHGPQKK